MSQPTLDRRVLIVDDDRQIRRVLSEFFSGSGYECRQAANGAEGLALFARRAGRPSPSPT